MNLEFKPLLFSELGFDENERHEPDEWGIAISKHFPEVDTFRNAPGGKTFYDVEKYKNAGLTIEFIQNNLKPYDQKNDTFFERLSIIDVLMFNSPEEVKAMIKDYYIL